MAKAQLGVANAVRNIRMQISLALNDAGGLDMCREVAIATQARIAINVSAVHSLYSTLNLAVAGSIRYAER